MKNLSLVMQKVFFKGMQVRPKQAWLDKSAKLGELIHTELLRNGAKLSCVVIVPPSNDTPEFSLADTLVIFSHPISRKAKYFFTETGRAKAYLERGCSVVLFDYNGFGESDGIDLFYWRDVVAVINYVKINFPNKKIVLHGASFGAFHILRAIDQLPINSKVILENVNKSLFSYWKRWPLPRLLVIVLQILRVRSVREMDVQKVLKELRRDDLDIRFIACENDTMTTLDEMRELYSLLTSPQKKFYIFAGATHLAAPTKDPELYITALFGEG